MDEEHEPWENLATCNHFLKEAEDAMKLAKEIYIDDLEDASHN